MKKNEFINITQTHDSIRNGHVLCSLMLTTNKQQVCVRTSCSVCTHTSFYQVFFLQVFTIFIRILHTFQRKKNQTISMAKMAFIHVWFVHLCYYQIAHTASQCPRMVNNMRQLVHTFNLEINVLLNRQVNLPEYISHTSNLQDCSWGNFFFVHRKNSFEHYASFKSHPSTKQKRIYCEGNFFSFTNRHWFFEMLGFVHSFIRSFFVYMLLHFHHSFVIYALFGRFWSGYWIFTRAKWMKTRQSLAS